MKYYAIQTLAHVFAAYMGAKCKWTGGRTWTSHVPGDLVHTLVGVDIYGFRVFMRSDVGVVMDYAIQAEYGHKLMLYSLKDITDKHVSELWALMSKDPDYNEAQGFGTKKEILLQYFYGLNGAWLHMQLLLCLSHTPHMVDYLRKHSYDVGYMDIPSLIDAGIAERIEVKKTIANEQEQQKK